MNAKQSLKLAAKKIEELEQEIKGLEHYKSRCVADIKAYNQVIESMIAGGNPCDWCEDRVECQLNAKGKGCEDWMLAMNLGGIESYDESKQVEVRSSVDGAAADSRFVLTGQLAEDGESGRNGLGVVSAGIDSEHQGETVRPQ